MFHIALHFLLPFIVAVGFFNRRWLSAYWIMIATMMVDLDHLLAVPIYDPDRCSIGFHPLHGLLPMTIYILACGFKTTRLMGIGLVLHMLLDSIDCFYINGIWYTS